MGRPTRSLCYYGLLRNLILIGSIGLLMQSCVSVNLGQQSVERSSRLKFTPPELPYSVLTGSPADRAWQSAATGNTIAFVSQCDPEQVKSLGDIERVALSDIRKLNYIEEQDLTFNQRAARDVKAQGEVDGISVLVYLRMFQKNGCTYTLSYIARPETYNAEQEIFFDFLKDFEAQ